MNKEEFDMLVNEILKIPCYEEKPPISAYGSINVDELREVIQAFNKLPDYNVLVKDNNKKRKEIERQKEIIRQLDIKNLELTTTLKEVREKINNFDVFKEFTFPLMKRDVENQVKSSIDYEWRKSIKEPILEILDKENINV